MSLISFIFLIILLILLITPYLVCGILKLALWRYQFSSKPHALFSLSSYKDIIFRVPLGLNMNLLVTIGQVSVQVWPVGKIRLAGLSVNILVKDEFDRWSNHQIELFKMIGDIQQRLERDGMLSKKAKKAAAAFASAADGRDLTHSSLSGETAMEGAKNDGSIDEHMRNSQRPLSRSVEASQGQSRPGSLPRRSASQGERTLFQRTIRNLLSSTMIELEGTDFNFYLYKEQSDGVDEPAPRGGEPQQPSARQTQGEDEQQLDLQNLRKFHQMINKRAFLEKHLCFKLHLPQGHVCVKAISDEDLDVEIKAVRCLMLNPCFPAKQGVLEDITVVANMPMATKMLKYAGNYDISIKIKKAVLDLNKKFIKKSLAFLTGASMLSSIIKVAKTIILKTHYQDGILEREVAPISDYFLAAASQYSGESWPQHLGQVSADGAGQVAYENFRDPAIPKRMKIMISEGIDLMTNDDCKHLSAFLDGNSNETDQIDEGGAGKSGEFALLKLEKTSFELVRKIQNTYFIIVRTDQGDLSIGNDLDHEALSFRNFTQEIDFTFRKELTSLPIKKQRLLLDNKIKLERLHLDLTASTLNYFLGFVNIAKEAGLRMSLTDKINGMLLDEEFLQSNVLQIDPQKRGTDYERRVLRIFKPLKYQDEISSSLKLGDLKLTIARKPPRKLVHDTSKMNFTERGKGIQHMTARNHAAAAERELLLQALVTKAENFSFDYSSVAGVVKQNVACDNVAILPEMRKPHERSPAAAPPLALLAGKNLHMNTVVHMSDAREQVEQYYKIAKLQLNVNIEVLCDMVSTFVDYAIITKQFLDKWQTKYRVRSTKKAVPRDVVEREVKIGDLALIWNLSSSRFVSWQWKNVSSVNEYFRGEEPGGFAQNLSRDEDGLRALSLMLREKKLPKRNYVQRGLFNVLHLTADEMKYVHYKFKDECTHEFYRGCFVPIEQDVIIGDPWERHYLGGSRGQKGTNRNYEVTKVQEEILTAADFAFRFQTTDKKITVRISGSKAKMILPDEFHFSAVMFEIEKQVYHAMRWYTAHQEQRITSAKFRYKKWASQAGIDLDTMAQQAEQSKATAARDLTATIFVAEPEFGVEDNNLKKVFTGKSEVVETLAQRRYTRVRQSGLSKFWMETQEKNLNNLYVHARGKNLTMQLELPAVFRDRQHILDIICSLDEGRDFIGPDTFGKFNPHKALFKIDYAYMFSRNLQKPILEVWRWQWTQTFVLAELSTKPCPSLFAYHAWNKIFQRFALPKEFNGLMPKFYYKVNWDIYKMRINIQGQPGLLFFNDLYQQLIARFDFEDISRSRDPNKKFLKSVVGMDKIRSRLHGVFKIQMLNFQLNVYAKRDFNRYDHYFQILCSDFVLYQCYQKLQVCMRDFIIKKEPLAKFETLFVKLPIVELHNRTVYNDNTNINHYKHQQNVRTFDDWIERNRAYMVTSTDTSIKLNIPTLGHYNEAPHKCLYLPMLMQNYAESSPIPFIHYQRSHLEFLNEFVQEFQSNRVDISGQVYRRMATNSLSINPRYTIHLESKLVEKQRTKFQGFINDIVLIMSDFKEDDRAAAGLSSAESPLASTKQLALDDELLTPEELHDHAKKDVYLSRYNGVMISGENLCVQSEFTYRPNHVNYFEINDSLASFNLFRFAKMTSKNLVLIRHPCFQALRQLQHEQSLDNFSKFCRFFELNENRELRDSLQSKMLQGYALPPIELQDEEMAITDHILYEHAYGKTNQINFNTSITYKQMLGSFKTLFPKYVLCNEQIQKAIQRMNYSCSHNLLDLSVPEGEFLGAGGAAADGDTIRIPAVINSSELLQQEKSALFHSLDDSERSQDRFSQNMGGSNFDNQSGDNLKGDFIFSENDTIGTIIHTEYRQDQKIKYRSLRQDKIMRQRDRADAPRSHRAGNQPSQSSLEQSDMVWVKHLIDIRGVRFLYTKKILELINHHFVKGFDFAQFKRRDYIESETANQKKKNASAQSRKIFQEYEHSQAGRRQTAGPQAQLSAEGDLEQFQLQKEALVAIKLEQAQLNFQNNMTESQMLIASPVPVTCVLFTFHKRKAPSLEMKDKRKSTSNGAAARGLCLPDKPMNSQEEQVHGFATDPLRRNQFSLASNTAYYTGYRFSSDREVIKYEMEVGVREMDCYVAPTFINLENPTFWMSQETYNFYGGNDYARDDAHHRQSGKHGRTYSSYSHESFGASTLFKRRSDEVHDYCHRPPVQDEYDAGAAEGENLLRKIALFNDISFNFEFLSQNFVDNLNPSLKLDILIESLEGQLNSSEWWHFNQILHAIILSRGEKAAEVIMIEKWRAKEMSRLSADFIRDIIYSKLKNQYKEQQIEIKPDMAKHLTYSINSGKLRLFAQNKQFSSVDVRGLNGNSLFYSNRESKQDLDIDRITIENLVDDEKYRWVLAPADNNLMKGMHRGPQTMIQCRFKDKFIVVSEAPWRVYDQIELDIFPSSIQLTLNLYRHFKQFLFEGHLNQSASDGSLTPAAKNAGGGEAGKGASGLDTQKKDQLSQAQEKKYQLLVPSKHVGKAKPAFTQLPRDASSNKKRAKEGPMDDDDAEMQGRAPHQSRVSVLRSGGLTDDRVDQMEAGSVIVVPTITMTEQARSLMLSQQEQLQRKSIMQKQQAKRQEQPVALLQEFPVFFKYFRMNEVDMTITYFHEKNSFLNSKELNIKLSPFIQHYNFMPFKTIFVNYEKHCKKSFISQIPNILKQKFLKAKAKVDEVANIGVTNSLMQGVSRWRDLGFEKRKGKKRGKRQKNSDKADGAEEDDLENQEPDDNSHASDASDSEDEKLDDEAKKIREQYLLEVKETKLREARRVLFGDFAGLR